MGQVALDDPRRLNEVDGIGVVLFDAGADGEDVQVEDNVFRWEPNLLREQAVLDRRWSRVVDATEFSADPALVDFRTPEEEVDTDARLARKRQPLAGILGQSAWAAART